MISKDGDLIELKLIPYSVLISGEKHHERRKKAQLQFLKLDIAADWKIPVKLEKIPWGGLPGAYEHSAQSAALAVTLLDILEEVEKRKIETFMILQDNVVFRSNTAKLLSTIRVPRDWRFLYFGGRNQGARETVSPGLARSSMIYDIHAVLIRTSILDDLRMALLSPSLDSHHADARIASLHKKLPAYLCRPSLAWQYPENGDSQEECNYNKDGSVCKGRGD